MSAPASTTTSLRCDYCNSTQSRCATSPATTRYSVTECISCGRIIQERHSHLHSVFPLRAHLTPLPFVLPDDVTASDVNTDENDEDPFHPTGFVTAFSAFSLEPSPLFARSSHSFSGHLAELERALLDHSSNATSAASAAADFDLAGPTVAVDHLRAYLQIIDVASILGLEHDISEHAFNLFRDCSAMTCMRNRSVEALATAALVQAIREAQEPRTLQEISTASNLPQKEIGKYIKILGEALKLSQPINSNSISVHMPRFCTLLQLNKSAQELAAHIGEVVINKCFCTRRNPISISAAAIYLACQLEDKRKTQAEICKVTGLTEVTLRKVYKELLENWDDLLPPNYTPAVPPEKAFPMTLIASGRSSISKPDSLDVSHLNLHQEKDKIPEIKGQNKGLDVMDIDHQVSSSPHDKSLASLYTRDLNLAAFWQPQFQFGASSTKQVEKEQKSDDAKSMPSDCEHRVNVDSRISSSSSSGGRLMGQTPSVSSSQRYPNPWQFTPGTLNMRFGKAQSASDSLSEHQMAGNNPEGATDG